MSVIASDKGSCPLAHPADHRRGRMTPFSANAAISPSIVPGSRKKEVS